MSSTQALLYLQVLNASDADDAAFIMKCDEKLYECSVLASNEPLTDGQMVAILIMLLLIVCTLFAATRNT